jgi:hypothetical protein
MVHVKAEVAADVDGDLGVTAEEGEQLDLLFARAKAAHPARMNEPRECSLDQCFDH